MNTSRVLAALTEALQSCSSDSRAQLPAEIRSIVPEDFVLEMAVGRTLAPVLLQESPFAEGGLIFLESDGSFRFREEDAARYLGRRVADGRKPEEAVFDLSVLLATERADCLAVLALWGVTVDERVDLTESLALLPFDSVPESTEKGRIAQRRFDPLIPMIFRHPPPCALCYRFTMSPVLIRQDSERPEPSRPHPVERLHDAALPIALAGPSGPAPGPCWTQYLEPVVERATGGSGMQTKMLDVVPYGFEEPLKLDPAAIRETVRDYLRTDGGMRARLRLSLTHFNRAMTRLDTGAKALDLAIALEALITDGEGEHTFKTALRAALLTEGSAPQRIRARALVSAVYRIRSAVVHNGVAPPRISVPGF